MAVPKRKTSKARKRKRRTHDSLAQPNLDKCPKCGSMHTKDTRRVKLMHPPIPIWSCLSCGFEWDRHDLIRSDDG